MSDNPLDRLSREELIDVIEAYRELYWSLLEDFYDLYKDWVKLGGLGK